MELIMFVGIPASGKSTESEAYRKKGYLILSSDQVREELMQSEEFKGIAEIKSRYLNGCVFERIRLEAATAIRSGRSVVVDATNMSRKRRMNFLSYFSRFNCKKRCILFITPPDICMKRNRMRTGAACVPDSAIYRMLCSFECPNYWEGWDEIVPVIYAEPYQFPFEMLIGFPQNNHHHMLTLDEHMNAAERYCAEQNKGDMLERVARYHDIGKLYTKRFENSRGEPTTEAHYLGHEHYGAYLYLCQMCCGRSCSAEEFRKILYEACLIDCHMRPLTQWRGSDAVKEKDRLLFGDDFMSDLIDLNRADRYAH